MQMETILAVVVGFILLGCGHTNEEAFNFAKEQPEIIAECGGAWSKTKVVNGMDFFNSSMCEAQVLPGGRMVIFITPHGNATCDVDLSNNTRDCRKG